ncbi:MFS transporter [Acidisoma cellulosilytica]|uniref:MFS transporter n=1 Tax=Acidisoma cellulosilyticum TaxID=2802395 RepID=A0A963Z204_9PROT|nr:MFS transporter [Acidisoma cellulosilyticum]MCB8881064.1 MFS transporter [Acidisoma cellulosilyticum]
MTEIETRQARRNTWLLALAQAMGGAHSVIVYATAAVIGNMLAPHKALATLPISVFVIGMALATLPAGAIAHRFGRRAAFLVGAACGVLGGLLAAWAIVLGSFALFCVAMSCGGVYAAVVLTFRFAAADGVPLERRAGALSAVMAGGIVAGVLGPQVVTFTMAVWQPYLFASTYVAQAGLALASAVLLAGVRLPPVTRLQTRGRPLLAIARQPKFIGALICGTTSYLLMNLLMTSVPLAMSLCGLSMGASNLGLQWHVIAMYAPSFITGRLIARFGAARIAVAGLLLIGGAAIVGLTGVSVTQFWSCLILLGIGWNFGFLGASALVLDCHRPEEKTQVQSFNDFVVFGAMVLASFSSGGLLTQFGWSAVCWLALPLSFVAILCIAAVGLTRKTVSSH